jgi:hypothetical protein
VGPKGARDAQEIALLLAFARLLALFSLQLRNVHQEMLSGLLDGTSAEQETRVISEHVDRHQMGGESHKRDGMRFGLRPLFGCDELLKCGQILGLASAAQIGQVCTGHFTEASLRTILNFIGGAQ